MSTLKKNSIITVQLTIVFFVVICCFSCQNIEPNTKERLLSRNNLSENYSLPNIWKSSDFVVIAYPTSSKDIGMTNVFKIGSSDFLCNCQETIFSVCSVFKGDAETKQFSLLHYNVQTNQPGLEWEWIEFAKFEIREQSDGPFGIGHNLYLLYLNKLSPSQFIPTTGQDSSASSVFDICNNLATQLGVGMVRSRDQSSKDPFKDFLDQFDADFIEKIRGQASKNESE